MSTAYLILESGRAFEGRIFGTPGEITGEVVFTTGMITATETLTDPAHHGQIVIQTFPLAGNYGIIPEDFESGVIGPAAYIVKHVCGQPSNFRCEEALGAFFIRRGATGLCGVDTRAVTKLLRDGGTTRGMITTSPPNAEIIAKIKNHTLADSVGNVSTKEKELHKADNAARTIAALDFGIKRSLLRGFTERGCDVWVLPHDTPAGEIVKLKPDGILLSNGPGNPAENSDIIKNVNIIMEAKIPMFGVGLGHEMLAAANGFRTYKMKNGHRGANQPVKDATTGRTYITNQNHGYAVDSAAVNGTAAVRFANLNDGACEGITYKNIPAMSVEFDPGNETAFIFGEFIKLMEER